MRTQTLVAAIVWTTACGGGEAVPPPNNSGSTTAGTAAKADNKVPNMKLGHYSSRDGSIGLVLDRTGDKPKVKIDGSQDITEVFVEDELRSGTVVGRKYRGPDSKLILLVSSDGDIEFLQQRGTARLVRDADADALGAPTKIGVAAPPSARDVLDEKLAALTVQKHFPELKPQDSGNLAKVKEVFAKAPKEMFLSFNPGKENDSPTYDPASGHIDDTIHAGSRLGGHPADEGWAKGSVLAKFGMVARGATVSSDDSLRFRSSGVSSGTSFLSNSNTNIKTYDLTSMQKPLAAKTPGVLWEMEDGLVFVTLDGGRYRLVHYQESPFTEGLGPVAEWPAPLQHTVLDRNALGTFVKGNAWQTKAPEALDAIEKRYRECSDKQWTASKDEFKNIGTADLQWHTKSARGAQLAEKIVTKVDKACGKEVVAYEKTLIEAIEARNKERQALHETAKARAIAVGATK